MRWQKRGQIFVANKQAGWMMSHAMIPTPILLNENVLRIYTTFCDTNRIGRIGYVDLAADDPSCVLAWSEQPCLDIGTPGQFDDNGVVCCSVTQLDDGRFRMYYVGFELCHHVRYRLFTGIAESEDGETFLRLKNTPVLDRTTSESLFRCGPFHQLNNKLHKLWYVAGNDWLIREGIKKPIYTIKSLESIDGVIWPEEGRPCFDINFENEYGFARPYICKTQEGYAMHYSIRDYKKGYRLGYARSKNGSDWQRQDDFVSFPFGEKDEWDSEMLCYSAEITVKGKTYLFYNGNNFGETGFGYAELIDFSEH